MTLEAKKEAAEAKSEYQKKQAAEAKQLGFTDAEEMKQMKENIYKTRSSFYNNII